MNFSDARRVLHEGGPDVPVRIAGMAEGLEDWSAERVLEAAATAFPDMVVTSSFGAESIVLLHLVHSVVPEVPVLFLDTGYHFGETVAYRREVEKRFNLRVVDVRPDPLVRLEARQFGDAVPFGDPDTCCNLRKTLPLRGALKGLDAWATGIRRATTLQRSVTPVVDTKFEDDRWKLKVAPIVTWSNDDVDRYIRTHDLPRHALVERGYLSIGCRPCTRPVKQGQDPRAGRWADTPEKTECGLHLDWDEPETAKPASS